MKDYLKNIIKPILRCNSCKSTKYSTISQDIITNDIKIVCLKCGREWK